MELHEARPMEINYSLFSVQSYITANLERVDNATFGKIGTGMTESSGVFTFPSTGIYLVTSNMQFLMMTDEIL